ncbi:RNA pseudouridine synthase, partial [Candidatus Saccharibacteria bacterium]|nr:RNA pseudouridine synthase [Candidatus Saccharibacteria bacterium]
MRKVVVDQNHQQRLDVFAHTQLPELSRSSVQKLIDEKRITVNGNKEKTGYKLKQGDAVTIDFDSNSLK